MKHALLSLVIILCAPVAFAHNGNDGWVTISNYKLWTNTYTKPEIRIEVSDGYYNPAGSCSDPDSYMVSTKLPTEVQSRIYSTLLSAALAKRPVRLRLDTNHCERSRPQVINIVIE